VDCPVNPPIKSGEGNDTGRVNPTQQCANSDFARRRRSADNFGGSADKGYDIFATVIGAANIKPE